MESLYEEAVITKNPIAWLEEICGNQGHPPNWNIIDMLESERILLFKCILSVKYNGQDLVAEVEARTEKEAKHLAAKTMLNDGMKLTPKDYYDMLHPEIDEDIEKNPISGLYELCVLKSWTPVFQDLPMVGPSHCPILEVLCTINGITMSEKSNSKKGAKKRVAHKWLTILTRNPNYFVDRQKHLSLLQSSQQLSNPIQFVPFDNKFENLPGTEELKGKSCSIQGQQSQSVDQSDKNNDNVPTLTPGFRKLNLNRISSTQNNDPNVDVPTQRPVSVVTPFSVVPSQMVFIKTENSVGEMKQKHVSISKSETTNNFIANKETPNRIIPITYNSSGQLPNNIIPSTEFTNNLISSGQSPKYPISSIQSPTNFISSRQSPNNPIRSSPLPNNLISSGEQEYNRNPTREPTNKLVLSRTAPIYFNSNNQPLNNLIPTGKSSINVISSREPTNNVIREPVSSPSSKTPISFNQQNKTSISLKSNEKGGFNVNSSRESQHNFIPGREPAGNPVASRKIPICFDSPEEALGNINPGGSLQKNCIPSTEILMNVYPSQENLTPEIPKPEVSNPLNPDTESSHPSIPDRENPEECYLPVLNSILTTPNTWTHIPYVISKGKSSFKLPRCWAPRSSRQIERQRASRAQSLPVDTRQFVFEELDEFVSYNRSRDKPSPNGRESWKGHDRGRHISPRANLEEVTKYFNSSRDGLRNQLKDSTEQIEKDNAALREMAERLAKMESSDQSSSVPRKSADEAPGSSSSKPYHGESSSRRDRSPPYRFRGSNSRYERGEKSNQSLYGFRNSNSRFENREVRNDVNSSPPFRFRQSNSRYEKGETRIESNSKINYDSERVGPNWYSSSPRYNSSSSHDRNKIVEIERDSEDFSAIAQRFEMEDSNNWSTPPPNVQVSSERSKRSSFPPLPSSLPIHARLGNSNFERDNAALRELADRLEKGNSISPGPSSRKADYSDRYFLSPSTGSSLPMHSRPGKSDIEKDNAALRELAERLEKEESSRKSHSRKPDDSERFFSSRSTSRSSPMHARLGKSEIERDNAALRELAERLEKEASGNRFSNSTRETSYDSQRSNSSRLYPRQSSSGSQSSSPSQPQSHSRHDSRDRERDSVGKLRPSRRSSRWDT